MTDPMSSYRTQGRPSDRAQQRRARSRRRRRRIVLGFVRVVFWTLVLVGVFIMGIGYGRTVSDDSGATKRRVTVEQDARTIEATLPTATTTVTTTVTVPAKANRPKAATVAPRG